MLTYSLQLGIEHLTLSAQVLGGILDYGAMIPYAAAVSIRCSCPIYVQTHESDLFIDCGKFSLEFRAQERQLA